MNFIKNLLLIKSIFNKIQLLNHGHNFTFIANITFVPAIGK